MTRSASMSMTPPKATPFFFIFFQMRVEMLRPALHLRRQAVRGEVGLELGAQAPTIRASRSARRSSSWRAIA